MPKMTSKQTLESLGLRVNDRPTEYQFKALEGKNCYGQLLENPNFLDEDQFAALAPTVQNATDISAETIENALKAAGIDLSMRGYRMLGVPNQEGRLEFISNVSEGYRVFQNGEMFSMVTDAVRSIGLQPVGNLRADQGRMVGHVMFVGAEEQVSLLQDTGENIMTGVRFYNSYDKGTGYGMEAFGVRTICCNYNLWGEEISKTFTTHANQDVDRIAAEIEEGFRTLIKQSRQLPKVILAAKDMELGAEAVRNLFWGIDFPKAYLVGKQKESLLDNLPAWEPAIKTSGTTLWNVYNAGTALLTHGASIAPKMVEYHSRQLSSVLSLKPRVLDNILARGEERFEAYTEKQTTKTEAKAAKKAAKANKTVLDTSST